MSERRGVLSAGTWCVDFNKSIARWPDEDTSNEVLAIDRQNGGSGSNMAFDLKRLDPDFLHPRPVHIQHAHQELADLGLVPGLRRSKKRE